ncbi:MAG: GntR family transcriptional regulator [Victivallaceae bacterium]|nr:GntR family transcriptional regulator [Victivallaceae bacterium]
MLKQIDTAVPLPKYYQIGESIKEKIFSGAYREGEKLPTVRKLAEYFDTTPVTVSNAMRLLNDGGYINKVHGKGMFVTIPKSTITSVKSTNPTGKIGIMLPQHGDLYQNLATGITNELERHDMYTSHLPAEFSVSDINITQKEQALKKIIDNGFDTLILDGTRHLPYKLLHKYRAHFKQLNFIAHYESGIDFPEANIIIFDAFKAGYLAAKHLIKAGHNKFLFITFDKFSPAEQRRNGCRAQTYDMLAFAGMLKALKTAGFSKNSIKLFHEARKHHHTLSCNELTEIIKKERMGIFASGDFRLIPVYKTSIANNLEIKNSFNIVGLYNTSWTEVLSPALTSISINENEIARLTADCISKQKKSQKFLITPELIKRET